MNVNHILDRLGRNSLGLVEHDRLVAAGITADQIEARRRTCQLITLQDGVYRTIGVPPSWRQSVLAACLAAGPLAVASHRAAASIWGLLDETAPVEVTVPYEQCPEPRLTALHRSTDLVPAHVTVRESIPVTKPARTLVDLGAVLPFGYVRTAVEISLNQNLTTVAGLRAMLEEVARRGRRGCGVLRAVLDQRALATARPESVLEAFFARLVRELGGEAVEYQVEVVVDGQLRRLDFAIRDALLGIEIDGDATHGTQPARVADRRRQNRLAVAGWLVMRYGAVELRQEPRRVMAEIQAVAEQRRALLCRPNVV